MFDSYALTVRHEAGEDFYQILFGDKVLATVSEPCGPGNQSEFAVYRGTGLDEESDEEAVPVMRFKTVDFKHGDRDKDIEACWRAAVRSAYFVAQEQWSLLP